MAAAGVSSRRHWSLLVGAFGALLGGSILIAAILASPWLGRNKGELQDPVVNALLVSLLADLLVVPAVWSLNHGWLLRGSTGCALLTGVLSVPCVALGTS